MTENRDGIGGNGIFQIPLLDPTEFGELLNRVARAAKPQLHLLGPIVWSNEESIWDKLFRTHGIALDRTTVFRAAKTPDLACWAEPVSLQAFSLMGCGLHADVCDLL